MPKKVDKIRKMIVSSVLEGDLLNYGPLMEAVGLDPQRADHRRDFGLLLARMNDDDLAKQCPPHSSVVVLAATGYPGRGFWEYVDDRGLREPGESDDVVFFRLLDSVFAFYGVRMNV
jgi:hypothetical protein